MKRMKAIRSVIILLFFASITEAAQKSLIDYFLLIPIESSLVSNVWGEANVFTVTRRMASKMRQLSNG
jgi:hypothetical protein